MTSPPSAYALNRDFPSMPRTAFKVDRHYLLYAVAGSMRLEHDNQQWLLPPARAALITAETPVWVTLSGPVTACSALFDPAAFPAPPSALSVFDMTALSRELILACRDWDATTQTRPPIADQLFQTLCAVSWGLSASPSLAVLPLGRSKVTRLVLSWTADRLDEDVSFDAAARAAAVSPRSLARRFETELGMTWSQARRKMRMINASEHLAMSGASVTEVALSVGYTSLSAFNVAFKEFAGTSPTEYRKASRQRSI